MIGLKRNKKRFWYRLYQGSEKLYDDDGHRTGETQPLYSDPVELWANISPATGQAQTETFGTVEPYDRVISPLPLNCPIDEYSVLYIDNEPRIDSQTGDVLNKHDYIVKQKAVSLNAVSYLITKVKVS